MKTEAKATAAVVLDTVRTGKDGTAPVKLRVIYDRKYRDYVLKYPTAKNDNGATIDRLQTEFKSMAGKSIRMSEADFVQVTRRKPRGMAEEVYRRIIKSNPRGIFESLRELFTAHEQAARNTIADLTEFSYQLFEAEHFTNKDKNDLLAQMADRGKRLRAEGRISTAVSFECAINSLREFTGKDSIPYKAVNVPFLKRYQEFMTAPRVQDGKVKPGNSLTTVGIYLRNVRTMFNEANIKGLIYPFGRAKNGLYQIPKGRNVKKALTQQQVATIAAYKCAGTFEHRSRDLWLFSYLCNGINVKDMARLRYADIVTDSEGNAKIHLIRAKTAGTTEDDPAIEIIVTRQIGRIIDRWGCKPGTWDQYIFPILTTGMSAEDEYRAIQQTVQTINKNMKRICEALEMEPVTTYTARHSFATVLKRSGASVEFISESLGHKNKQTTQNYLANFEDDEKRKWAETLLPTNDNEL